MILTKWSACVCVCDFCRCVTVCTEWSDSRLWLSACLNQEYMGCVSALRSVCGPLRQASGFRLHVPIGCFCWTKTQPEPGLFFKEAVSLLCSLKESSVWCWLHHISLMKHFYSNEIISHWWDHFCVINIWMESEYLCYPDNRHFFPSCLCLSKRSLVT